MVHFKSWRDMYLFLKKYHNFSCLQCKYYHIDLSDDKTYTDTEYARFFCPNHIAMVRLDFQQSCQDWESYEGVKLKDVEGQNLPVYKIDDEILDILDNLDTYVSIQEIDAIIEHGGV